MTNTFNTQTFRMIVKTSVSGTNLQIRLTNAFGTRPITFGSAFVGRQSSGAVLVAGSNRQLRFGGAPSVTIPPGASALSDPLSGTVAANTMLAVSVHVVGNAGQVTGHAVASQVSYVSGVGDFSSRSDGSGYTAIPNWFFLDGVLVTAPETVGTVVCLGDSITDGTKSKQNANHRYPDYLAARLQALGTSRATGVANVGISSNRLTGDGTGVAGLARFDRDVLAQPGVNTLVFMQGINDIRLDVATRPEQLTQAYRQIVARAHAKGIRVIGGTLMPFYGDTFYTEQREALRQQVNAWIRTSGAFDAMVDFDKATRDPSFPRRLRPTYDSGDHIHPNDAGYNAMANAINLNDIR
jgi:lysophospholipase L1-like esterase